MHEHIVSYQDLSRERRIPTSNISTQINGTSSTWDYIQDGKMEDCMFKQILTYKELTRETRAMQFVREHSHTHYLLALHPTIDLLKISGFNYAVYYNYNVRPLDIHELSSKDIQLLLDNITIVIHKLHESYIIHNCIHQSLFHGMYKMTNDKEYPLLRFNGYLKSYKCFREEAEYSESPYPSPLQIILEILSSNIEPEEIEYKAFKKKVGDFWNYLSLRTCGLQLVKISQEYASYSAGAIDYIDYAITRYCTINESGFIVKTKSKALGYLRDIDLFGLAISIYVLSKNGSNLMHDQRKYLGECVLGITEVNHDDNVYNKPFNGVLLANRVKQVQSEKVIEKQNTIVENIEMENEQPKPMREHITQRPKPQKMELKQIPNVQRPEKKKIERHTEPQTAIKVEEVNRVQDVNVIFKNGNGMVGELVEGSGIKKIRVQGVERIVRSEQAGEYILWKGDKLYI